MIVPHIKMLIFQKGTTVFLLTQTTAQFRIAPVCSDLGGKIYYCGKNRLCAGKFFIYPKFSLVFWKLVAANYSMQCHILAAERAS